MSRGPLLPYLFILCVDAFSSLLNRAVVENKVRGIAVARNALRISHLFFADDSLLFSDASTTYASELAHIINAYVESVNEYFTRALTIANKMKANGEDKGDVAVVEKILRFMTPKFDYVKCSIEESKDTVTLTIDELQISLLVHEQRMSSHVEKEHALKIIHGDQSRGRGRGHGSFRGRGRGRGRQSFDKATVECYNCHKLGHFQWECPSKEKEANYVETQVEMLLMVYVDMNKANREDMWFLDSGCSNHMCGKKEYFSDFDGSLEIL
ncbi:hypothetical protein F0562_032904 [Nyssa sinensis]|uniref:CCHC-type domain-containing protein n=1 Tax=Nyssa sinensis TaxID=561372 RepID=A0A5J5ARR4_9ASTE|nr:hypothetical protein F0562_032904 [Nyssa sinensis]